MGNLRLVVAGIIIGVVVLFAALLLLGSQNPLGTQNHPYNSTFGYRGSGYYAYKRRIFYAQNSTVFNSAFAQSETSTAKNTGKTNTTNTTVSTTGNTTITSSATSNTTIISTTSTVHVNSCYQKVITVGTYANQTTIGNCTGYIVAIGTYGTYINSNGACPSTVTIGTYGTYFNNVSGCNPTVTSGTDAEYYDVNTGNLPPTPTKNSTQTNNNKNTTVTSIVTSINQYNVTTSDLQSGCSLTGSQSSYTGTLVLIQGGQTCALKSNYYFTSTLTTNGPVLLLGTFSTNGNPVEVYVVNQSELSSYKTVGGLIEQYRCTFGSVITGSLNCEVPAGNWSILIINDGQQTSTITYTSDVNASYVAFAEEIPFNAISIGSDWSLSPKYHEYESFSLIGPTLLTGGFSSSGVVSGYVMSPTQFEAFNSTGNVTDYYCTTGTVISSSIGCAVPAGDWYFVLVNPSYSSSVNVNWEDGLTAYGLLNGSTNDALYDEQFGLTFADSYTSLAYNVTAKAQVDTSDIGPSYLLNGYSNTGYWYQIGLSYNWADSTQHDTGFNINYDIFAPDGSVIDPSTGGGGVLSMSGPVYNNDTVRLGLSFSNGDVVMTAYDLNTDASGSIMYSAEGATEFVGNPSSTETGGFFTGLMTEWYHVVPWYGGGGQVDYNPYGAISSPAWLWVDEFYCYSQTCGTGQRIPIFSNSTSYPMSPAYTLQSNGATLTYSNGGTFTTGTN
jgi:hypothetical protein